MSEGLFDQTAYIQELKPESVDLEKDPYRNWESEISSWTEGTLPIEINWRRVDTVLDGLMEDFYAGNFPYNLPEARPPHIPENMPTTLERGSRDHAMFHFACCYYMRGGIKSFDAYTRMSAVYEARPDLFDCSKIVASLGEDVLSEPADTERIAEEIESDHAVDHEVSHAAPDSPRELVERDIAATLKRFGLGFQETTSRLWVENAVRMQERYQGDPRKIFQDVASYDESLVHIQNDKKGGGFMGFQEKMTSMIIYFLMDDNMIDTFKFPIPVDIHVMRVSINNELITFPGVSYNTDLMRPETTAALRQVYLDYAERKNVDPLRLCDAVWLLSGLLCSRAPGNWTIEPRVRQTRDGRRTPLIPVEVNPDDPRQMRAYEQSCRNCPTEGTCTGRIGSAAYYVGGVLANRGPRLRFPPPHQGSLLP